jgi:hypothetical protein
MRPPLTGAGQLARITLRFGRDDMLMVVLGIDAHMRTHTVVPVDAAGRQLGVRVRRATSTAHLELVAWADRFGAGRRWAVEDCPHLRQVRSD